MYVPINTLKIKHLNSILTTLLKYNANFTQLLPLPHEYATAHLYINIKKNGGGIKEQKLIRINENGETLFKIKMLRIGKKEIDQIMNCGIFTGTRRVWLFHWPSFIPHVRSYRFKLSIISGISFFTHGRLHTFGIKILLFCILESILTIDDWILICN